MLSIGTKIGDLDLDGDLSTAARRSESVVPVQFSKKSRHLIWS